MKFLQFIFYYLVIFTLVLALALFFASASQQLYWVTDGVTHTFKWHGINKP